MAWRSNSCQIFGVCTSFIDTYLTAVSARVKDGRRDSDDLVAVDVGPAACAETSLEVRALNADDNMSTCGSGNVQRLYLHDRSG